MLQRSRAALRSAERSESARTILTALVVNLVVAAAKLVAGLLSGSAALLAEAAHSFADSLNEVFLAAISSFLIGGCVSIGLAIWELVEGHSAESLTIAWVVLGISLAGDGVSLMQGLRQARREAHERGQSLRRFLARSSDP